MQKITEHRSVFQVLNQLNVSRGKFIIISTFVKPVKNDLPSSLSVCESKRENKSFLKVRT